MEGRKLALARQAVGHAIRLLNAHDELGVVVYDHDIETVLERMPATPAAKQQALARLGTIEARGTTDLSGGWWAGARSLGAVGAPADLPPADELPLTFDAHASAAPAGDPERSGSMPAPEAPAEGARVSRVLLLTDGLANRGVTDADALRQTAARYRTEGVSTSTFGLGADFDEELLTSIATHGGGHFYFIEQAGQIADFLASELGEVLDVVARDAVFEVSAGPGVDVTVLNGLPVERADGLTRVRLGDLVAEQEVTLLVAVTCDARTEDHVAWVECRVRDRDQALFPDPMRVAWARVSAARDRQQPVNRDVLLAVAQVLAEGARARALAANRRGAFDQAGRALHDAADELSRLGPDDNAVQAIAELLRREEGVFAEHMGGIERKARHFASYSLTHSRGPGGRARKSRA